MFRKIFLSNEYHAISAQNKFYKYHNIYRPIRIHPIPVNAIISEVGHRRT